jgi:hypothetical protein
MSIAPKSHLHTPENPCGSLTQSFLQTSIRFAGRCASTVSSLRKRQSVLAQASTSPCASIDRFLRNQWRLVAQSPSIACATAESTFEWSVLLRPYVSGILYVQFNQIFLMFGANCTYVLPQSSLCFTQNIRTFLSGSSD